MMGCFGLTDFHGISPVLYAFWDERERLDADAMRHQVERCIAAGAHGITVLGLVTEINKMDRDERLELVRVVGKAINGRIPYSVTIGEPSIDGQASFAEAAADAGADWVILQPPPVKGVSEAALLRFFSAVADRSPVPVAIQNNPVNLDVWLSTEALVKLVRSHPKISLIKGEGSALAVASLCKAAGDSVRVFAGHGGVEFPLNLAGGCVGLIPAPELLDRQIRVYEQFRSIDPAQQAQAHRLHTEVLPWIVMMTRAGVENMLLYGKRLMARRLGLPEPRVRAPGVESNAYGLAEVDKYSALLGPL